MREEEERRQEQQRREEARIAREGEEMRRLKEREAEKAKEKQVDQSKVKPLVLSHPPPLSVSPFFKNYVTEPPQFGDFVNPAPGRRVGEQRNPVIINFDFCKLLVVIG